MILRHQYLSWRAFILKDDNGTFQFDKTKRTVDMGGGRGMNENKVEMIPQRLSI